MAFIGGVLKGGSGGSGHLRLENDLAFGKIHVRQRSSKTTSKLIACDHGLGANHGESEPMVRMCVPTLLVRFGKLQKEFTSMLSIKLAKIATVLMAVSCLLPLTTRASEAELAALHAVLKSDASIREKGVACKRLAVIGTKDSIPVLAELLTDVRLAHYARFGLEAIPDPAVDRLFRESLSTLKGEQLIGVINSGHRKGGTIPRCVGEDFEVRAFATFAPMALAASTVSIPYCWTSST